MPGFYPVDEYDLAGFSVGVVDKAKVFDKTTIQPGDVILGLPSSGVHSNGFSLVRKVLDVEHADLKAPVEALGGRSLGETLLTPTRIYVKSILALMEQVQIKSVSHITGGGFYENIPRSLPQGMTAKIKEANVPVLPIFTLIEKAGSVPRREMFNTFNMGIGMTVVVAREEAEKAMEVLQAAGEQPGSSGRNCRRRRGCHPMVKTKIAVLVSGGGTNLQALLDAQREGVLTDGEIVLVISSNDSAYALTRAAQAGVPAVVCSRKALGSQAAFEAAISQALSDHGVELLVLAGFMSILSADFTSRWPRRILNVHPSLIPAFCGKGFYGLKVHQAALDYGVKVTGATVHFVNEVPDGGEILLQKAVEIQPGDTPETLQRRVMEQAEWKLLPQATQMISEEIRREKDQ